MTIQEKKKEMLQLSQQLSRQIAFEIKHGIAPHHIKAIGLEQRRPGFVCSHIIMRDGTKHVLTGVDARKALDG